MKKTTPTQNSFNSMRQRCNDPNCAAYKRYGARGIKVCDEWATFKKFLKDMGERPPNTTLDRIDGGKGYFKDNCRWATQEQQNNNHIKSFVPFEGKTIHYKEICQKYNIRPSLFKTRIYLGWTISDIIRGRKKAKISDFEYIQGNTRREQIIWLRSQKCTLQEIGNHFKITRERVRQIEESEHFKGYI